MVKDLRGSPHKPMSSARAGSGGRFSACVQKMSHRKGVRDPQSLCAALGRSKFGKGRYQKMAASGRRRR